MLLSQIFQDLSSYILIAVQMHRCLMIVEVVRAIADSIDPYETSTLLHMALSCKAFFDPVMDALWRTLQTPGHIIRTLPEHTRGKERHLELVSSLLYNFSGYSIDISH